MSNSETLSELEDLKRRVEVLELKNRVAGLEAENLDLRGRVDSFGPDQTWLYLVQDKADGNRIIYVGITQKQNMRQRQHFSDPSSSVYQYIKARGGSDYSRNIEFIILPAFASRRAARIAERMLIGCLPGLANKDVKAMARWCQTINDGVVIPFRNRDGVETGQRGRPISGNALTPAEKQRRYRERLKARAVEGVA